MSFFNKLKKGVSEAGAMAKVTVEVNRLKLQISSIKKEISELHTSIGKLVYEQHIETIENNSEIKALCEQIKEKYNEIEVIQQKIIGISGEKKCECGITVPIDTRFCSQCGHQFTEEAVGEGEADAVVGEPLALEAGAIEQEHEGQPAASACYQCSQPIEADSKFCEHCGATTQ